MQSVVVNYVLNQPQKVTFVLYPIGNLSGLRPRSPDKLSFSVGQRVYVAGQRRGIIRFIGTTQFAPGTWYGVELDQAVGKNDGSVNNVRYFTCSPGHGIFAPLTRIQRLPSRAETPQVMPRPVHMTGSFISSTESSLHRRAWSTTTSPMVGRAAVVVGRPSLPSAFVSALQAIGHQTSGGGAEENEPNFYLCEGMLVLCGGETGRWFRNQLINWLGKG